MNKGNIEICGITPEHCFPDCIPDFFTQYCETDKISIYSQDPDIQEIIRVSVTITTRNFKTICTSIGKQLLVHATKDIELIVKSGGIRFTSKVCIPFCVVIVLDNVEEKVSDVQFIIEDIEAFSMSPRCVAVSTLILAIPAFKPKQEYSCCGDANEIRCDIKIRNCTHPACSSAGFPRLNSSVMPVLLKNSFI